MPECFYSHKAPNLITCKTILDQPPKAKVIISIPPTSECYLESSRIISSNLTVHDICSTFLLSPNLCHAFQVD